MIEIRQLQLIQGEFTLNSLDFELPTGTYGVLMGRSGCGKTSLIEAVAGLRPIQSGSIKLDGEEVSHKKPAERGVGYVPQDRALFPTFRVRDQMAFSLVIRRRPTEEIAQRVDELAALLDIKHLLDRMPQGLSGGEAQRVALGRALACDPSVLLLDEPLSALDEELHDDMCRLLKNIHQHSKSTILHITHSQQEAQALGDCQFKFEKGQVVPLNLA